MTGGAKATGPNVKVSIDWFNGMELPLASVPTVCRHHDRTMHAD